MAIAPGSRRARLRRLVGTPRRRIAALVVALAAAGGIAALVLVLTSGPEHVLHLHTRPDLHPPAVEVVRDSPLTAPGDIFVAPKDVGDQSGPMILDHHGRLVWFHPVPHGEGAFDFRVQMLYGSHPPRPVLTWWQGRVVKGHGEGEGIIADRHYRIIARIHPDHGWTADLHEFQLTSRGTALITVYRSMRRDLSAYGGSRHGTLTEGIIEEVDIRTGRVVFEWHSLGHVALSESYRKPTSDPDKPWDYFHINSIGVDRDGNLLVSARHTSAIYKIDRRTGRIIWRLGGKRSDFRVAPAARFAYQHDARRAPDGTLTLFDNESPPQVRAHSRGLALRLDPVRRTATVAHVYTHDLLSSSQGNVQSLPGGNVFVGWGGDVPWFSEYTHDGRLLFDARFVNGDGNSYRAYRQRWSGRPGGRPAVAAVRHRGRLAVYASWNGATAVRRWEVLGGARRDALAPLGAGPWTGLESEVSVPVARWVAVRALGASGRVLGASRPVEVSARG